MSNPIRRQFIKIPANGFIKIRYLDQLFAGVFDPDCDYPFKLSEERIIGQLLGYRLVKYYPDLSENRVELSVLPFDSEQKTSVFAGIKNRTELDCEISVPFSPLARNGTVRILGDRYWSSLTEKDYELFDQTEQHIRYEIARHVQGLAFGATVMDPACSTGACLYSIKNIRPDIKIEGFDIVPSMIQYAQQRFSGQKDVLLELHNACDPFERQVDMCVVRCAEHFVTTPDDADRIVANCIQALKRGGILIVTGVTPLFHTDTFFRERGLKGLQTVAKTLEEDAIFPFYRYIK